MKKKNQYLKIKNNSNEFLLQMEVLKKIINQPVVKDNSSPKLKAGKTKHIIKIEAMA
jgi:hypothetical protein